MGMNTASVQRLYVAYFNRPADPISLAVYEAMLPADRVATQAELLVVAETYFSPSTEYTSNFDGKSNSQIVNQLYQNIFGREAEAEGLISWATKLTDGSITVAELALQLSFSAQGTDAAVVDARIEAATTFTDGLDTAEEITGYSGDEAAAQGRAYLAQISGELPTTVEAITLEKDSAIANVDASIQSAVDAGNNAAGTTYALTTGLDTLTGTSSNDTFSAVIGTNATTANGTTLNPGDNLTGGNGTDTLAVAVAGTHTTAQTISAFDLTSIESVMVSNFQTSDANDTTLNLSLASGITKLGVSSSAASGDTLFTGVQGLAAAEMNFGAGDLSITYADTAVSGSADTQTLALNGVTAGTFTAAATSAGGVETLEITSSGATRNVLTGVTNDAALTTINVAGTQALTLGTLGAAVTTFDASGNSGGVTAIMSGTTTATLTGSSNNDVFTSGTVLTTGSVSAGDGVDTLAVLGDTVVASATLGAKYTGFDVLSVNQLAQTANNTRSQDVSFVSGVTVLNATSTATTANGDITSGLTFSNLGADTNTLSITGLANADTTATDDYSVTVTATRAANTVGDSMTVNLGTASATSGATAVGLNSGAGAVILDVSLANEETITVNSLGASGSNFIDDFTNTSATSMVFTGARALTVDSMSSTIVSSIDASAMTGAFINNANSGAVASTIAGGSGADTLTGGSAADTMSGNAGADSISGAAGADVIDGGAGADTIVGGAGADSLTGGAGDDVYSVTTVGHFIGLADAETLIGGDGNDNLSFDEATTITIAATDLLGLSSVDRITIDGAANAGSITLTDAVYTANGVDTLRIIDGDLTQGTLSVTASALTGTNAIHVTANTATGVNDTLTGGAGADTFVFSGTTGLEATDTVVGGAGADTIALSAAAAVTANLTGVRTVETLAISGNGGNVSITVGADAVIAASGSLTADASSVTNTAFDLLYDGSAVTTATKSQIVTGTSGVDTITGGAGSDQITGGDSGDVITGGGGIDNLSGGAGGDTFAVATTGSGFTGLTSAETVSGGTGTDKISVTAGIVTIAATDLSGMTSIEEIEILNTTQVASLTLSDAIYASNGNASLIVDAATMTSGVLTLAASGLTAANSVTLDISSTTNSGANVINLGAGGDTVKLDQIALDGGTTIAGGTGADTIEIEANTGGGATTLSSTVTGFETIQFAAAGVAGTYNMITADTNVASGASLTVNGSNLTGTLLFNGSAETNGTFALDGGTGNDTLTGGAKADTIDGGAGADSITGGLLADTLTGDVGADIFAFGAVAQSNSSNTDSITDFVSGTDKLNITLDYTGINSGLTVDATVQTARAGTTLIQENLSGARGQATYDTTGSALYINVNADNLLTTADYKIAINPAATATGTIAEGDLNFVITGGDGDDTITAGGGADTINGGAGADAIVSGAGADAITAGNGNDTVTGGDGLDHITIGTGTERVVVGTTTASTDIVEGFTSTADKIEITTTLLNGADATITDAGDISGDATVNAAIVTSATATQYIFSNAAFDLDLTAVTDGAGTATELAAITTAAIAALDGTAATNLDATFLATETVLFVLDDSTDSSSAIFAFNNADAADGNNTITAGELTLLAVVDADAILANGDIIT